MIKSILVITITFFVFVSSEAQSFDIYKGDTVNYINKEKQREGDWIILKKGTETIYQKGIYISGRKEGLWTIFYSNGHKKSEISYLKGEKRGYAKTYFDNGNIAEEGTWQANKWVGKYKMYYRNGKLSYSWNYDDKGTRSGYQQYFYENGKLKIEGKWEDGKENGLIKEYYSTGALKSEKNFDDGKFDSNTSNKYEFSENKIEKNIRDTNKTIVVKPDTLKVFEGSGHHVFYNKYKKIEKEGTFSGGILIDGKHYIYNENKELIKTLIYKDGKITEIISN